MSQCSRLCSLPRSMCDTDEKRCAICRLRMCEFNFSPYREDRCHVKLFLRLVAQRLGWNVLVLWDKTESQFDQYMFWGYAFKWFIDKDTLQPVW